MISQHEHTQLPQNYQTDQDISHVSLILFFFYRMKSEVRSEPKLLKAFVRIKKAI